MSYVFERLLIKLLEGIGSLGRQTTEPNKTAEAKEPFAWLFADLYHPTRRRALFPNPRLSQSSIYLRATGAGKSKLIEFLIRECIKNQSGFSLIDPHGDLYTSILKYLADLVKRENFRQARTTWGKSWSSLNRPTRNGAWF